MSEQRNSMETHVQIVAILSLVWGALAAIGGLVMSLFTGLAPFPMMDPMGGLGGIMGVVFLLIVVLAALAIAAGIGLLQRRPWGRTTGFVVAGLSLFSFPFGTAFGVYTFWVLAQPGTVALLEDAGRASSA